MRYLPSDLAKLFGVTTNTIRRYEQSGFLKPNRDPSNFRWYEEYDVSKTAMIRLYIKCGFSHAEIRSILGKSSEEILTVFDKKLAEMDEEMDRLKRLRHWLKDSADLIKNTEALTDTYTIRDCSAIYYIIASIDDEVLNDKGRRDTVNYFLYRAPEVVLFKLYKKKDIARGELVPYSGWFVRENDLDKFHMTEFIASNRFVEYFPRLKSYYTAISIPLEEIYDQNKVDSYRLDAINRAQIYFRDNGLAALGDMLEIPANGVGDKISLLLCFPFEEKE